MNKYLPLCLLLSLLLSGCGKQSISAIIEKMGKYPVQMSLDRMVFVTPDSIMNQSCETNELKMVVFADTTDCSQCYISHLKQWNDLLPLERKYPDLSFCFVIEARKNEVKYLSELLRDCGLYHTIYIDTAHVLLNENPHLDVPSAFHTFLLDGDNRVVLVGNPLDNPNVENLFMGFLKSNKKRISTNN